MQRIWHIIEHSPNNFGQFAAWEQTSVPAEYFTGAATAYLQTSGDPPAQEGFMQAAPTPASAGWSDWQADITVGSGDGWGGSSDQHAFSGFRQNEGEVAGRGPSSDSENRGHRHDRSAPNDESASVRTCVLGASNAQAETEMLDWQARQTLPQTCSALREEAS